MRSAIARLRTLVLPYGASITAPHIVIGTDPIPTELATYYSAGVTGITPTAPETVVAVIEQAFDGNGNYEYRVLVVDSSATRVTSIAYGATVAGVVNEAGRFMINPGALISGARYQIFTENTNNIFTADIDTQTVQATRVPGDTFDRWSLNPKGTQGWGDGTTLTDVYLARIGAGQLEIGSALQLRNFGAATDIVYDQLQDGESNIRFAIRGNGMHRWSDGTNAVDTVLYRDSAAVLRTDGRLLVGGSGKDVAASCEGINNVAGAGTTTSATYVNIPATSSFSFIKQFTATRVEVTFHITAFSTVAATVMRCAIQINSVDTDISQFFFNEANSHRQMSGTAYMASGLTAGTYTVQGRWRRVSGTGTLTLDANDWLSISAKEVSA